MFLTNKCLLTFMLSSMTNNNLILTINPSHWAVKVLKKYEKKNDF